MSFCVCFFWPARGLNESKNSLRVAFTWILFNTQRVGIWQRSALLAVVVSAAQLMQLQALYRTNAGSHRAATEPLKHLTGILPPRKGLEVRGVPETGLTLQPEVHFAVSSPLLGKLCLFACALGQHWVSVWSVTAPQDSSDCTWRALVQPSGSEQAQLRSGWDADASIQAYCEFLVMCKTNKYLFSRHFLSFPGSNSICSKLT